MKIFWKDARALGYCRKGIIYFLNRIGVDVKTAKTVGIDEELLYATNDIMAIRVIESVKNRGD